MRDARLTPVVVPFQIPRIALDRLPCQRSLQIVGFLGSRGWVQLSLVWTSSSHLLQIFLMSVHQDGGINGISSFRRLKNRIFSDGKNRKVSDGSSPGKESERAARESVRDGKSSLRLIVGAASEGRGCFWTTLLLLVLVGMSAASARWQRFSAFPCFHLLWTSVASDI